MFEGKSFHTAHWDHQYDFKGKNVAVIGNAASALQIIPKLANIAQNLYVFQRTPNWILPKENYSYSKGVQFIFAYVPFAMRIYRWFLYWRSEYIFFNVFKRGPINDKLREAISLWLTKYFDLELAKQMTPNFEVGCKRTLLSDRLEYYECFKEKKAILITDKFEIAKNYIQCHGSSHKKIDVDAIILATGFNVAPNSISINVRGRANANMNTIPNSQFRAYLGISLPHFPNLFVLVGPHTGLGHNSIIFMIENQVNYIMEVIKESVNKNAKAIEIKNSTVEAYYKKELNLSYFKDSVWNGCSSW